MGAATMTLAELLKDYRRRHFVTQRGLAEALGVDLNTVQRWEQGGNLPRADARRRLLAVLGVTPEELLAALEASKREIEAAKRERP